MNRCGHEVATTCDRVEALRIMRTEPVATRLEWTADTMIWMDLVAAASVATAPAARGSSGRVVAAVMSKPRDDEEELSRGLFTES